jgi:serine/threonine-protein kinase
MEYLSGGSLARLLEGGPLPPRRAAELVRQVARGVCSAHRTGVLHRDLKPGNVLLDADGNARVADFGLAKLLDSDGTQTVSEALMGTPSYMAPEQAAGRTREVSPATDTWALGVILYECLTGRPPFRGTNRQDTLQRVLTAEPVAPARLRPDVPRELEAVCLKCLEKQPRHRYPTAGALADDLDRWLRGEAPAARPRAWPERCWRWLLSHRKGSAAAVLLLAAALAVAAALLLRPSPPDPDRPRRQAEAALAAGQAYEFKGSEPLPGPFRWVVGDAVPLESDPKEGCFSYETFKTGLLELLADPGCDRYLFSAEVRHDDAAGLSHVGLYFGYREHHTAGGRQSGFYTHTFADSGSLLKTPASPRDKDGNPLSKVKLRCGLFERRQGQDWAPTADVGPPRLFMPKETGQPATWRALAVKVTPEGVETFWRDERGLMERSGRATAAELERVFHNRRATEPNMAGLPSVYKPRSGLGLFVFRGQAAFRQIRVQPLGADGVTRRRQLPGGLILARAASD